MKLSSARATAVHRLIFSTILLLFAAGVLSSRPAALRAQEQKINWSAQEKPIAEGIGGLRRLTDDVRVRATKDLALEIRNLPVTPNKVRLAYGLAMLSTEGDFGHDTLQEVATTLADALREQPLQGKPGQPPRAYVELAELVRYEHVEASLDDPQFATANSKMEADNAKREQANFTLPDLSGKAWTLTAEGGTPTKQSVPVGRSAEIKTPQSWSALMVLTIKSKHPATSFMAFDSRVFTKWWAPRERASSSFPAEVEKAVTSAPNARANWTAMWPSPPMPTIPTREDGLIP